MAETIPTTFDPSILPEWAQRNPDVVWLAKRHNDFRCAVCSAESEETQKLLARQAMQTREGTLPN